MTYTEKYIENATNKGYYLNAEYDGYNPENDTYFFQYMIGGELFVEEKTLHEILLDQDFWRCLEKAGALPKWDNPNGSGFVGAKGRALTHRDSWHRFIDHLADGGTPESFFESLEHNIT